MTSFKDYLQEKNFSSAGKRIYLNATNRFEDYLNARNIRAEKLIYSQLLDYVKYLTDLGYSKRSINMDLGAIRHLLDFWVEKEILPYNLAADLVVRGVQRTIPSGLLTEKQLDKVYLDYPASSPARIRNKVTVGLMLFQAVRPKELALLKLDSVDLKNQTIFIPETSRSNSRTLLLHPLQITHLELYVKDIRYQLLNGQVTDQLLVTGKSNKIDFILNNVKFDSRNHTDLKSWQPVRASVITRWLKEHHLRQVQYMAGHKYISSTERYLQVDLEDIQAAIDKHHPLA